MVFILRTVLRTEVGPNDSCYKILLQLLSLQPKDTFTMAVLQQMAALASLHWMSGEVKTIDLRWVGNLFLSLTQFYSFDFLQSRIGLSKWVFNKCTIKVCISCPGTSAPNKAHLTVSLYLYSSGSNARGESRALEGRHISS